jgi:CheY-like chemotaxis protein
LDCNFHGKRVLVAEDNTLLGYELADYLADANAVVVGPCASLAEAQQQSRNSDLAVLDVDLGGELVFPLADQLLALDVPFIFFTALPRFQLPRRFDAVECITKTTSPRIAVRHLQLLSLGKTELTVEELVPGLRRRARELVRDVHAADRLVELTLRSAITEPGPLPAPTEIEAWLIGIMHRSVREGLGHLMN